MNINKKICFLVLAIILVGCKKNEKSSNHDVSYEKSQKVIHNYEPISIKDSLIVAKNVKITYEAEIPSFNNLKTKSILDSMYFNYNGLPSYSKEEIEHYLIADKKKFLDSIKMNFKESKVAFNNLRIQKKQKVISIENGYLHLQFYNSLDFGNFKHTYFYKEKVFDLQNEKKMVLNDITKMPISRLENLLLKNIDQLTNKSKDMAGDLKNSEMVLVDVIPVTDNFYFDEEYLYFHYNPNEIAAYNAGDIIIPISWKELSGTLKDDFAERLKK